MVESSSRMFVRKAHRPVVFSNPNQVPPDTTSRGASISKSPSVAVGGHHSVIVVGREKNSSRLWQTRNRSFLHSKKTMHMILLRAFPTKAPDRHTLLSFTRWRGATEPQMLTLGVQKDLASDNFSRMIRFTRFNSIQFRERDFPVDSFGKGTELELLQECKQLKSEQ